MTHPTADKDFRAAKNVNDIVYAVAERARELAGEKMDDLRLILCNDPEGRIGNARSELTGYDRGKLIEAILIEEFIEEFPRNIEQD